MALIRTQSAFNISVPSRISELIRLCHHIISSTDQAMRLMNVDIEDADGSISEQFLSFLKSPVKRQQQL